VADVGAEAVTTGARPPAVGLPPASTTYRF
jgi:hypothetical protein